jgi:hypothetical protein
LNFRSEHRLSETNSPDDARFPAGEFDRTHALKKAAFIPMNLARPMSSKPQFCTGELQQRSVERRNSFIRP